MTDDPDFARRVQAYSEAAVTEQLQLKLPATCGRMQESGSKCASRQFASLSVIRPSHVMPPRTPEQYSFKCMQCGAKFKDTEFLERQIRQAAADDDVVMRDDAKDFLETAVADPIPSHGTPDYRLASIQFHMQLHGYNHSFSCFKNKWHRECRFNYGFPIQEKPLMEIDDETGNVSLLGQRYIGNSFVVAHNIHFLNAHLWQRRQRRSHLHLRLRQQEPAEQRRPHGHFHLLCKPRRPRRL
jgi:hypothetical protein